MKKNKSAFSLVVAIWLVLIMTMLVLYILEYMIPYSKNVKWIENSSNAFYQAENSIEDWLLFFKTRTGSTKFADQSKSFGTSSVDYKYKTISTWNLIPYNWEWNSEFDTSFNTISQWNPIQLDIWNNVINFSTTKFSFKIPEIEWQNYSLSWSDIAIINWQLSADTNTLNASWSWILTNDLNSWILDKTIFDWSKQNQKNIKYSEWQDLNWNKISIKNFYSSNCWNSKKCSLKFSIINKLETTNWVLIPYLEYKIKTNNKIPLRFSRIKSEWKSYGFQKHLEVRVPQQTTNQAFDFTVFQ